MGIGQRPNRRLRLQRLARGWSQDDVAAGLHRLAASTGEAELGVDATMVSRWERGTRRPRPRYVRLLSRLFELPADQLGVVEDDDDVERPTEQRQDAVEDDVERRDFLSRMTALLGAAAVPLPGIEPADADPGMPLARALGAAGEADDRALVAYLTASAACQPPHRELPQRRVDQLQAVGAADATAATRVWLAAKEADAHALLGDADACLRALDQAQQGLA